MSQYYNFALLSITTCQLNADTTLKANLTCIDYSDVRTLEGNSIAPVVLNGTKLLLLGAYYKCNKPRLGEVVLYRWGNNINLAKIIKAQEGDLLEIKKLKNKYQLYINKKPLFNSLGESYSFKERKSFGVLTLSTGVIPKNRLLLLGESIRSSYDSKKFGLVSIDSLSMIEV
ncbi:MAG TPA: signal peptidase I [Campylobacterales bacterium]|nr:signal peptidase I [Campylobacterales bacterium]